MNVSLGGKKVLPLRKLLSSVTAGVFLFTSIISPASVSAQSVALPAPGTMLNFSPNYAPAMIKGMVIHPENALQLDFIVNTGQADMSIDEVKEVSDKMIRYFLAALTVPEEELWVNLSPYESDRIIPPAFGMTEMGRDLLVQDYLLKQLTASLMYPEDALGEKFWDRVYAKAQERFGTTDIPMSTFNKIWIVPKDAKIYEHEESRTVFIVESSLEVMLEEDYVALQNNMGEEKLGMESLMQRDYEEVTRMTSDVVREILIPEIEKEINGGETFANLRQIYNAMILAAWYKINLKESLLGRVYADQNKVYGVNLDDPAVKEEIYNQYVQAFEQGVYQLIKEDYQPQNSQPIPRVYFSGGFNLAALQLNTVTGQREPIEFGRFVTDRWDRSSDLTPVQNRTYLSEVSEGFETGDEFLISTGMVENTGTDTSRIAFGNTRGEIFRDFLNAAATTRGLCQGAGCAAPDVSVPLMYSWREADIAIKAVRTGQQLDPVMVDSLLDVAPYDAPNGDSRVILSLLNEQGQLSPAQQQRFRQQGSTQRPDIINVPQNIRSTAEDLLSGLRNEVRTASSAAAQELALPAVSGISPDNFDIVMTSAPSPTGETMMVANVVLSDTGTTGRGDVISDMREFNAKLRAMDIVISGVEGFLEARGAETVNLQSYDGVNADDTYKTFGTLSGVLTERGDIPFVVNFMARPAQTPDSAMMSTIEIDRTLSNIPVDGWSYPEQATQLRQVDRAFRNAAAGDIDRIETAMRVTNSASPKLVRSADKYLQAMKVSDDDRRRMFERNLESSPFPAAQELAVLRLGEIGDRNSLALLEGVAVSESANYPVHVRQMAKTQAVNLRRALVPERTDSAMLSQVSVIDPVLQARQNVIEALQPLNRLASSDAEPFIFESESPEEFIRRTQDLPGSQKLAVVEFDSIDIAEDLYDADANVPVIVIAPRGADLNRLPPNVIEVVEDPEAVIEIVDRIDLFSEIAAVTGAEVISRADPARAELFRRLNTHAPVTRLLAYPGTYRPYQDNMESIDFLDQITEPMQAKIDDFRRANGDNGRALRVMVIGAGIGVDALKAVNMARINNVPIDLTAVEITMPALNATVANLDFTYGPSNEDIRRRIYSVNEDGTFDYMPESEPYDIILFNAPDVVDGQRGIVSDPTSTVQISQGVFNNIVESARDRLKPDGEFMVSTIYGAVLRSQSQVAGVETPEVFSRTNAGERALTRLSLDGIYRQRAQRREQAFADYAQLSQPQAEYHLNAITDRFFGTSAGETYVRAAGRRGLPRSVQQNYLAHLRGEMDIRRVFQYNAESPGDSEYFTPEEQATFLRTVINWRLDEMGIPSFARRVFWERESNVAEMKLNSLDEGRVESQVAFLTGIIQEDRYTPVDIDNFTLRLYHAGQVANELRQLRTTYEANERSAAETEALANTYRSVDAPDGDGTFRSNEVRPFLTQVFEVRPEPARARAIIESYLIGGTDTESFLQDLQAQKGNTLTTADVEWLIPVIEERVNRFFGSQSIAGNSVSVPSTQIENLLARAFDPAQPFSKEEFKRSMRDIERARISDMIGLPADGITLQRVQAAQLDHIGNELEILRTMSAFDNLEDADMAMVSSNPQILTRPEIQTAQPVGGIDLNPAMLDLQIRRDGQGIPLPLDQQPPNMKIQGFAPVILNVAPITGLPMLLGQAGSTEPITLTYAADAASF